MRPATGGHRAIDVSQPLPTGENFARLYVNSNFRFHTLDVGLADEIVVDADRRRKTVEKTGYELESDASAAVARRSPLSPT